MALLQLGIYHVRGVFDVMFTQSGSQVVGATWRIQVGDDSCGGAIMDGESSPRNTQSFSPL